MTSSIADHKTDSSSKTSQVSPDGDSGSGAQREQSDAARTGDAPAGARGEPGHFLDLQETVISKRPPLSGPPSAPGNIPIVKPGAKEFGESLVGTNLEHFELKEFVGGGGMGAVFRAVDSKLGRTVAVKVLLHERTDEETQRRFENEAQNAARLDHENIARVYHVGEDHGLHYIVFEFIEGINIRDLVEEKGPLPLVEAISYVLQVAEALQHASQRDVVHRDIKPSNVLITGKGRAKLVDMGLARLHHLESDSEDLTASGVTLGTFDYISPEQARDPRLADVRSDLYSLGCTLYFMLTGRPPFPEGTVLQKLLSHSSEEPSDPRLARPDLDAEVVRVLNRLLAKQPDDRFQQPSELVGELLLVARRLNLDGIAPGGKVWVATRRSRFSFIERALPWAVPIVGLIAAVFAMDRWAARTPAPDFEPFHVQLAPPLRPADGGPRAVSPAQGRGKPMADATAGTEPGAAPGGGAPAPASGADGAEPKPAVAEAPEAVNPGAAPTTPEASATTPDSKPDGPGRPSSKTAPGSLPEAPGGQPAAGGVPEEAGSSAPSTGADGEVPLGGIVVAPMGIETPTDSLRFDSLADACRAAAERGITTVELRFDGMREERAFDVAAEKLTIRNAEGFRPTVVFRPNFEDLATDRQMIRMDGGALSWQAVGLRMELPAQAAVGWSLFHLKHIVSLEIRDSIVTVRNVDASGRAIQQRVSLFEIQNGTELDLRASPESDERFIPPYIRLVNSVARGQATVVHAEEATPFRLALEQCLVVTPRRLVDVEGAHLKPRLEDGRIDVVMKNVTAVLGQGMCRLSSGPGSPFQLDLVTDCRDGILFVTDPEASLIERRGVQDISEVEKRLYVRGRDNFYPGSMTLLRINPSDDPGWYEDYGFERRDEPWFQEESPRFTLMWKGLPGPDRTADRQTPADYALDPSEHNPAYSVSGGGTVGVDPSRLPALAATAPPAVENPKKAP